MCVNQCAGLTCSTILCTFCAKAVSWLSMSRMISSMYICAGAGGEKKGLMQYAQSVGNCSVWPAPGKGAQAVAQGSRL